MAPLLRSFGETKSLYKPPYLPAKSRKPKQTKAPNPKDLLPAMLLAVRHQEEKVTAQMAGDRLAPVVPAAAALAAQADPAPRQCLLIA
jgi:hypothetical protein